MRFRDFYYESLEEQKKKKKKKGDANDIDIDKDGTTDIDGDTDLIGFDGDDEDTDKKKKKKKKKKKDDEEEDEDDELMDERTEIERKKVRARTAALDAATNGQFKAWDLRKRAQFLARHEFKLLSPTTGRFVKRSKPLDVTKVFKQMRKQSKQLKKTQRVKGKQIARKALRVKRARGTL